jgi:hypothetical protein
MCMSLTAGFCGARESFFVFSDSWANNRTLYLLEHLSAPIRGLKGHQEDGPHDLFYICGHFFSNKLWLEMLPCALR